MRSIENKLKTSLGKIYALLIYLIVHRLFSICKMIHIKNIIVYSIAIVILVACQSEDIIPKLKPKSTGEYVLLTAKTEITAFASSKYSLKTEYEYDTLSDMPQLKRELNGNDIKEYKYLSDTQIQVQNLDVNTKKVVNKTTYQIQPNTKNVLKQVDNFGIDTKFEYNVEGYLTKSDFEDGVSFEYKDGNLSKKTTKANEFSYVEEFTYGSETLKIPVNIPFFYGKPNKTILIKQISTSTTPNSLATTQTEDIKTTFDSRGYILTERHTFENGGYVEIKYEYKLFKN